MSVGLSGRIVLEIPPSIKRSLYSDLEKKGISLKEWFLDQANIYLKAQEIDSEPRIDETVDKIKSSGNIVTKARSSADNSALKKLSNAYKNLEKSFPVRVISNDVSYTSPVNFVESLRCPRHRWFPYKEGFSPTFVKNFFQEFGISKSDIVVDPFSGVGTTAIVSALDGRKAFGFDVSPMAHFIASAKSINLNRNEVKELSLFIESVLKTKTGSKVAARPDNETVISYFDESYLDALLAVKLLVGNIESDKVAALGKLAFLTLVETFSTHRKAGNGVKRKTRHDYGKSGISAFDEVKNALVKKLLEIETDLHECPLPSAPEFSLGSCLDVNVFKNIDNIGISLTSPPYANCFDYSKIYQRELWLGDFFKNAEDQKEFRKNSLRSHVHATWAERHAAYSSDIVESLIRPHLEGQELWSNKIPDMLSGYFKDMGALLHGIKPRMKRGAAFGLVVGNSTYGGIPVATDLLIGEIATSLGFKVERIDVYRGVIPSSQQYSLMENRQWARESTVVLKKK